MHHALNNPWLAYFWSLQVFFFNLLRIWFHFNTTEMHVSSCSVHTCAFCFLNPSQLYLLQNLLLWNTLQNHYCPPGSIPWLTELWTLWVMADPQCSKHTSFQITSIFLCWLSSFTELISLQLKHTYFISSAYYLLPQKLMYMSSNLFFFFIKMIKSTA